MRIDRDVVFVGVFDLPNVDLLLFDHLWNVQFLAVGECFCLPFLHPLDQLFSRFFMKIAAADAFAKRIVWRWQRLADDGRHALWMTVKCSSGFSFVFGLFKS